MAGPSSTSQQDAAGPSSLKTPQMDQSEWGSASTPTSSTPSRQAFPKPLSLGSQPVASTSSSTGTTTETPRRGKRSSISYIPSPATSSKATDDGLSRAPSTSSASGRTRTGSISRATSGANRVRRTPSQTSHGHTSDADDWLMSEEDASFSLPAASRSMAERDSAKVEALFNDTGYREGITAGKLSTLQNGFDQAFNEVGALLGRRVGILRGQVAALLLLLSSSPAPASSSGGAVRGRVGRSRGAGAGTGTAPASLPLLAGPRVEEAKAELGRLARDLNAVTLAKVAEPDYEAMEHEREHEEVGSGEVKRETEEERVAREQMLDGMEQRLSEDVEAAVWSPRATIPRTSRRTPSLTSSDDAAPTSHDLLRLIAEKERHCFELREQLSVSESQLKALRSTWQRLATKELAYSSSPSTGHHRRDGSTASSSTSEVADAWNTFSSKLPGSLKTQLNNLLDSIANVDAATAGAGTGEKQQAKSGGDLLRPTGGGLGVLEEEGSDVGSVASPRSPVPSLTRETSTSPNTTITSPPKHGRLASLAAQDSQALGFTVDANGIATPIPAPGNPGNGRNSILSSLTNFQSTPESTGTFASMFAKRLKEARDNASDLLREAERKLGNAMTLDELSGPQIKLEEASNDSPWYEAAGGQRRSGDRRSPNLKPAKVGQEGEEVGGRLSVSSDRSSEGGRGRMSPVLGGMPGATTGVFGMLMGRDARRESGDSWGWGGGDAEDDDDWDGNEKATTGRKKVSS